MCVDVLVGLSPEIMMKIKAEICTFSPQHNILMNIVSLCLMMNKYHHLQKIFNCLFLREATRGNRARGVLAAA